MQCKNSTDLSLRILLPVVFKRHLCISRLHICNTHRSCITDIHIQMYFSRTKVTAKRLTTQMATSAASPRPRPRQQGPRCARQEPRTALQKLYPGRVERCQWGPLLRQCRRDSFSDFWVILCKRLHVSLHDCARHSETAESKNLLHSPSEKTFKRLFHLISPTQ